MYHPICMYLCDCHLHSKMKTDHTADEGRVQRLRDCLDLLEEDIRYKRVAVVAEPEISSREIINKL